MTALFTPACSITRTQRRRYFWAAWWTAPPSRVPFRKPDASNGGARTPDEARREAEAAAGGPLAELEPRWARAWMRVLRGQPPWTGRGSSADPRRAEPRAPAATAQAKSLWEILGVGPDATLADIKRAYRQRALAAHPDHGGDAAEFRALHHAYEKAVRRRAKKR